MLDKTILLRYEIIQYFLSKAEINIIEENKLIL